jgi:hypothetical protein
MGFQIRFSAGKVLHEEPTRHLLVERIQLPRMMAAVQDHVIPRYEFLRHFLGLTVIKADAGTRAEVIVTSFWDDGLEGSEQEASRFIDEIVLATGRNPSRKAFDTLGAFRLGPATSVRAAS